MPPYNMAIANKIGKEFFRLLKKNFLLLNNLYKIFNRNMIKLSYSTMPHVTSLINKSNNKKLGIINVLSPLNAILQIKRIATSRGSVNLSV